MELLPFHLDPKKLPSEITKIVYKFDSESIRWRLDTASTNNKKYTFLTSYIPCFFFIINPGTKKTTVLERILNSHIHNEKQERRIHTDRSISIYDIDKLRLHIHDEMHDNFT